MAGKRWDRRTEAAVSRIKLKMKTSPTTRWVHARKDETRPCHLLLARLIPLVPIPFTLLLSLTLVRDSLASPMPSSLFRG